MPRACDCARRSGSRHESGHRARTGAAFSSRARSPRRDRGTSPSSIPRSASASGGRAIGVRLAIASVVAAVLIVVGFHVVMAEGQLQLERLNRQTTVEQQRYESLRLTFANRSAPQAIVKRATSLGMIPATSLRYITVPGLTASGHRERRSRRDGTQPRPGLGEGEEAPCRRAVMDNAVPGRRGRPQRGRAGAGTRPGGRLPHPEPPSPERAAVRVPRAR